MGADGTGPFENDDAMDFLSDLLEGGGVTLLEEAITGALKDQTYIDLQEGSNAVAAAAVVAVSCGLKVAEGWDAREDIVAWIEGLAPGERRGVMELRRRAADALDRITETEGSELCELWMDSGDTEWMAETEALTAALRGEG